MCKSYLLITNYQTVITNNYTTNLYFGKTVWVKYNIFIIVYYYSKHRFDSKSSTLTVETNGKYGNIKFK